PCVDERRVVVGDVYVQRGTGNHAGEVAKLHKPIFGHGAADIHVGDRDLLWRLWDDRQIADDRVADVEGRRIALALRRHPQGDVGQVEVPDSHGPVGDVGVVTGCWNAFRCPVLRV